jgi:hypothetical protein
MARFEVKALDETTWPDFADLVERHNGIWGGCWCTKVVEPGPRRRVKPPAR